MAHRLYGLVLNNKKEKKQLLDLCNKEGIPIMFPELFEDDKEYHLWAFDINGIALAGTMIMRHLSSEGAKICHGVKDMEEFLSSEEWKEHKIQVKNLK